MMSTRKKTPLINGLVLAGGKSRRMGIDKGTLDWHGKEQRYYLADTLGELCEEVFISCRAEQIEELDRAYHALPDAFLGLGPYGALLTALQSDRKRAWLVVACDLPLLDKATIQFLAERRDPDAVATAFKNERDGLPEPLIAIWEPKSYRTLLYLLGEGVTCPRKALIKTGQKTLLDAPRPETLMNANTPEEAGRARTLLKQSSFFEGDEWYSRSKILLNNKTL